MNALCLGLFFFLRWFFILCIPGIQEGTLVSRAMFVLVVEDEATFSMLVQGSFSEKFGPCLLITVRESIEGRTRTSAFLEVARGTH